MILPTNDEQPELFAREFVVLEGMSIVIDTPLLSGADADLPPAGFTQLTALPRHGANCCSSWPLRASPSVASPYRIQASTVVYERDDSETTEDSFEKVWLSGLKHTTHRSQVPHLTSDPWWAMKPRLTINNGLEVETGH